MNGPTNEGRGKQADAAAAGMGAPKRARDLRGGERTPFPAIGMLRDRRVEARLASILDANRHRLAPSGLVRLIAFCGVGVLTIGVLTVRPAAALPPAADTALPRTAKFEEQKLSEPKITLPPQEILIQAIYEDDLGKAQEALSAGADPNAESASFAAGYLVRSTPLGFAAEQGRFSLVRLLTEHGASANPKTSTWMDPIDAAIRNGFSEIAKYLHEHGAACGPLAYAAAIGDLDRLKQLATDASQKLLDDAAIAAAGCGQIAALRQLAGKKCDPTKAFHRAASDGAIESMQYLLDHGLNLKEAGDEALLKAAAKGQVNAIDFLLKAGVKADPEKQAGATALHEAARRGAVESVKLLLKAGANPNSLTAGEYDKGRTPLFSACDRDNPEIARLLLDHGARMDIVDQRGFTPVLFAAYSHASRCLALLIDRGGDLKAVNPIWKCDLMDFAVLFSGEAADRPDTVGTMALVSRGVETVRVLLDKGTDVNRIDGEGLTPLSGAISNGQTACMEMLLQRGARVNVTDRSGATLLIRAIEAPVQEEWRLAVVNRLFALGLDPNIGIDNPIPADYPNPSALKTAICLHSKLLNVLLAHGARFAVKKGGNTEKMLLAASTGDLLTVQSLLAQGVSPNVADARGWTPLLSASALGHSAILHALVRAGAKVNASDAMGLTALQFAITRYPDLTDFRLLLDKGADVNSTSEYAYIQPALSSAINHSDPALTLELLKRGADPNRSRTSRADWFDPIEQAVDLLVRKPSDEDRRRIVKLLLQFGADPSPRRSNSQSLLFYPVANNIIELAKFLLAAGIDPRKDHDGGKEVAEQAERHGSQAMKTLIQAALEKNREL